MQPSKISLLSRICQPGFLLIAALLLTDLSFLVYQAKTTSQKVVVLLIAGYLSILLLKKYAKLKWIVIGLILLGVLCINLAKKPKQIELNEQTCVQIYPDQVKISDNWLSGIGKVGNNKLAVAGKITDEQERLLNTGESILLTKISGEISEIEAATNLGQFNYKKYYEAKNIYQQVKFKSCELLLQPNTWSDFHKIRFTLQKYFAGMPRLLGFFASELILAENPSSDNQQVLDNYRDLGVIHLLSISGLHVGIYTLIISVLCYKLKITEEATFVFILFVLLAGIFLSNGQPGFIRASLTYILGRIFKFNNWRITGADLLGLTCIVHLIFIPRLFLSTGAILSYVLVLGLQLTNRMASFKQSILLNLFLTPLLLFNFYQVNVLTVIFNTIIVPYFNYVVMPITFFNVATFSLTQTFANKLESLLENVESFIGEISNTHLGILVFGKINWWQCLLLLLISAVFLVFLNEKPKKKKLNFKVGSLVLGLYISFFCFIHYPLRGQVTFIDVGQGDSILITTPFKRKVYMIDTGGKLNFSGKKTTPQINKITIPLLKAQGISKIDGLFVTHQDADHVGDLGPLLDQIQIDKLYMAKGLIDNPSFQKRVAKRVNHTKLVELLAGMEVKEAINFNVVYPFKPGEGKNEDSLSLMFNINGKRWLFTGDLGQEGEKEIMSKYGITANYFKLGHHGSKTSSNAEFLKNLHPELVFISAGRNNRFGHPHAETINTLKSLNIPWVSTQDYGMISWYYGLGEAKFESFVEKKQ